MALSDADVNALIARAYARDPSLTAKDVNTLLRASFTASPGNVLVVADFNAVEPRTTAWASGDEATLAAFRAGDPYVDMAADLMGLPKNQITKKFRQLGKVAVIGCSYGLGNPDKLADIATKQYGVDWTQVSVTPEEVIAKYRETHPEVVAFWSAMNEAAVNACDGYTTAVGRDDLPFVWGPSPLAPGRDVWMMLPSGRPIVYYKMRYTRLNRWPYTDIVYTGNKNGRVCDIRAYGGLFTENSIQAFDRELLGLAMVRAEADGWECVMTTHDEIVLDVPRSRADEAEAYLTDVMCQTPDWAAGLPLKVEIFQCERYRK